MRQKTRCTPQPAVSDLSSIEHRSERIINLVSRQLNFDFCDELSRSHSPKVAAAIEKLSSVAGTESRGAIFTRAEVGDFILDLVGYTGDKPLYKSQILEPSFGGGDFLLPIVGRLLTAWRTAKDVGAVLSKTAGSDLHF
jgi:hypothetical protein